MLMSMRVLPLRRKSEMDMFMEKWNNGVHERKRLAELEKQELEKDKRIEKLIADVHTGSKQIHKTLGKLLGANYTAKQVCKWLPIMLSMHVPKSVLATGGAEAIRTGFEQLLEVATAIAEPILWFYALTACIMIATGRTKREGIDKLKNVGYAYITITLLPALFSFFRFLASMMKTALEASIK